MTEVTTAVETAATTVDPNAQAQAPATPETTAPEAPAVDEAAEQPRDLEGKFLPKHPRVEKLQSKINELTRVKHDTAREVAELRAQKENLQRQLSEKVEIDPTNFEAMTAHQVQRAIKTEKLEDINARERSLHQQSQRVTENIISTQVEGLREQIKDIDLIYAHPPQGGPVITPMMAEALSRVENGALVAYHLAKHPDDALRLANSDPYTVLTEIGRISAQVKPATPVRRVSQAPQPVQTVSGGPGNPAPDLASLDFRDYERIRNEQELARR